MSIKTVMDLYNYNDYIDSMNQSPFFFLDLLNESAMNMYDFEREENEGYHSENENNFKNPIINHENSTDCNCNDKTNSNTAPNPKKNSSQKDDIYDFLSVDEIKQNLKLNKCVNDTNKEIIEKIISIENEENNMKSGKKIIINDETKKKYETNEKEDNYTKKKRGRKTNENDLDRHDKYSSDNIIKKGKSKFIKEYLEFMNRMINQDKKLLKISYEHFKNLKREKDLELLEKPLKDFFSLEVSSKYSEEKKYFNEDFIKEIFKNSYDKNSYNSTIKFLFKITLDDWINLFTYKTDMHALAEKHKASNVDYEKIKQNFNGVEHLLKEISKKNNNYYYSLFLLHIFNYQRWFYKRKGRNNKIKKNK